jgi:hypothetical protein
MWAHGAEDPVSRIGSAVVFAEGRKPDDARNIGPTFHIGDGFFAAGRPVIGATRDERPWSG